MDEREALSEDDPAEIQLFSLALLDVYQLLNDS
jgi:hypothetical protein